MVEQAAQQLAEDGHVFHQDHGAVVVERAVGSRVLLMVDISTAAWAMAASWVRWSMMVM
jgi:hypothetical protein